MYILFNTIYNTYTIDTIKDKYNIVIDFFIKINLNKKELQYSNFYLKTLYLKIIKKRNYNLFCYYFFYLHNSIRKIFPPFILKILRKKNLIP